MEALKVVVGNNAKYQLVKPASPQGVHVMMDILPHLKKMGFIDYHLRKFPELEMKWYMNIVRENKDGPIHMVTMD